MLVSRFAASEHKAGGISSTKILFKKKAESRHQARMCLVLTLCYELRYASCSSLLLRRCHHHKKKFQVELSDETIQLLVLIGSVYHTEGMTSP